MLVDSSVWLEIFLDGKLKHSCQKLINHQSAVPTLVYFEVYKKLKTKFSESQAMEAIASLSSYKQLDLTQEVLLLAADLSIEYQLGMADSLVLAQAHHYNLPFLTLDNDFARIPGVKVLR